MGKRETRLLSASSADSPLLWIRIDPDMAVLRRADSEQADFMWQYQLRYERDVVAQQEAIAALERFPTPASRLALTDVLEQEQCFYRVRMAACFCLAKVRPRAGERGRGGPRAERQPAEQPHCPAACRLAGCDWSPLPHCFTRLI